VRSTVTGNGRDAAFDALREGAGVVVDNWVSMRFWQGRDGRYHDMRGENARSAKLTEDNVREIKRTPTEGEDRVSNRELGRRYGVSEHAIIRVRKGITWSHVTVDDSSSSSSSESA
jgi:hypothetical protein